MAGGLPSQAVGAFAGVLIYSIICFTLCTLFVCFLLSYGERWTCTFTAISSLASIIQQIHYATSWAIIKKAQYDKAVENIGTPALTVGGAAQKVDVVLFTIQYYCYNVMSLNILFWAVGLFCGSWDVRSRNSRQNASLISKIVAIVWPGLIIGLQKVTAIQEIPALFFIITYVTMFASMLLGGVLLILTLYKYMKTRRLVTGNSGRGGWWASVSSKGSRRRGDLSYEGTPASGVASNAQRSIYDRALITRFTIGFIVLAIFEAAIIVFSAYQSNKNSDLALSGGPNYSLSSTIADIVFFIPGVTASLVVFLVFGTTKSWRQYWDLVAGGCGLRARLLERRTTPIQSGNNSRDFEFERLPSIQGGPVSDISVAKGKEVEDRVRMFSPISSTTPSIARTPARTPEPMMLETFQLNERFTKTPEPMVRESYQSSERLAGRMSPQSFHRPFRSLSEQTQTPHIGELMSTTISHDRDEDDPVIQYERPVDNRKRRLSPAQELMQSPRLGTTH